jgi:hypothetical protein
MSLATHNLAHPVMAAGIAILAFLLTTQLLPKAPARSFISANMAIHQYYYMGIWFSVFPEKICYCSTCAGVLLGQGDFDLQV